MLGTLQLVSSRVLRKHFFGRGRLEPFFVVIVRLTAKAVKDAKHTSVYAVSG
jgi:hypothetical protein